MSDLEKRDWESYKKLTTFDFKCLEELKREKKILQRINWKYYTAAELLKKFIDALNRNDVIEEYNYQKWFEWKYEIKEGETGIQIIKQKGGVHLDDSDGSNPWIRAVYYVLWGKRINTGWELDIDGNTVKIGTGIGVYKYGWGNFRTSYWGLLKDGENLLWGSDTMNTIASYRNAIENYKNKNDENEKKVDELCRKCHCLGNFVLVPAYFNQRRGGCDQIDVALDELCEGKITIAFSFKDNQRGTAVKKLEVAHKKFNIWDKDYFTQYINMFFLWDYVKKKDEKTYYVKDMKSNGEPVTSNTNVNEGNVGKYIVNANAYIEKRSIFMAAMLKIAVEFKDDEIMIPKYKDNWGGWDVSAIYKYIVKEVFLQNDKTYSGYDKVFGEIKEVIRGITNGEIPKDIKSILDNAQEEIDEVGKNANDKKRSD